MAALGVLAKIRVPYAHTSLEIIRMRYGKVCNTIVFFIGRLLTVSSDWACCFHSAQSCKQRLWVRVYDLDRFTINLWRFWNAFRCRDDSHPSWW